MSCCADSEMRVTLRDRMTKAEITGLHSEAIRALFHNEGGARSATVELCDYAGALEPLLMAEVEIAYADGSPCWCGFVQGLWRCCGDAGWGLTLQYLRNRIAVRHSVGQEQRQTAWVDDLPSQAAYGVRELLVELPADSLLTADAYRDRLLAELSQPLAILSSRSDQVCECGITTLQLSGWWESLDWQYDRQLCGYANSGYTGTGGAHAFGLGVTSDQIGFRGSSGSIGGPGLEAFPVGDEITVSGAVTAGNNANLTITRRISIEPQSLTDNTISFDPLDDVMDSGNRLGRFTVGEMVTVAGSALNDGTYFVKRSLSAGDRIELTPNTIALEAAGAAVTVESFSTVGVDADLETEGQGALVTVLGKTQRIGQRIAHDAQCADEWNVNHARLTVRKVGNPGGLWVGIGPSCTPTETALIAGVDVSGTFATFDVIFTTGVSLPVGGSICVTIWRDDAPSVTDYFELASTSDSSLIQAQISPDGATWSLPKQPFTIAVELFEDESITDQAQRIAMDWAYGTGVDLLAPIAYSVPAYRQGWRTQKEELERLIFAGEPGGGRLKITIDCMRQMIIDREQATDEEREITVIDCDGCPSGDLCALTGWVGPESSVTVPGDVRPVAWLNWHEINFAKCRVRYRPRGFELGRYAVIFEEE